jgi:hypothetical protein
MIPQDFVHPPYIILRDHESRLQSCAWNRLKASAALSASHIRPADPIGISNSGTSPAPAASAVPWILGG